MLLDNLVGSSQPIGTDEHSNVWERDFWEAHSISDGYGITDLGIQPAHVNIPSFKEMDLKEFDEGLRSFCYLLGFRLGSSSTKKT